MSKNSVEIYTDGACSGNPGPGGWGAVLSYSGVNKEIYGYDLDTTNNKMELQAAIEALKTLKRSCDINLYTDSSYLKDGVTKWIKDWQANNWIKKDKKPVKNIELWMQLVTEIERHTITWHWVKAHNGNIGNELADKLAVKGRDEASKIMSTKF
jgi:ribonuclease HI